MAVFIALAYWKVFDNLKNDFHEKKAWATGKNSLEIQSQLICMSYNFLRFITEFLKSEKGIDDEKYLDMRQAKAQKKGRYIHPFL